MARQEGLRGVVVPDPKAQEAAVVEEISVQHVASLSAATHFMAGASELTTQRVDRESICLGPAPGGPDLADVKGQPLAKRAVARRYLHFFWSDQGSECYRVERVIGDVPRFEV